MYMQWFTSLILPAKKVASILDTFSPKKLDRCCWSNHGPGGAWMVKNAGSVPGALTYVNLEDDGEIRFKLYIHDGEHIAKFKFQHALSITQGKHERKPALRMLLVNNEGFPVQVVLREDGCLFME